MAQAIVSNWGVRYDVVDNDLTRLPSGRGGRHPSTGLEPDSVEGSGGGGVEPPSATGESPGR